MGVGGGGEVVGSSRRGVRACVRACVHKLVYEVLHF